MVQGQGDKMLDREKVMGVDFSEFTGHNDIFEVGGLLYYRKGELTDKHYIKNVYTYDMKNKTFVNTGKRLIYVVGEVEEGDYLTTSEVYGAAMKTDNKELAFAVANSGRLPAPDIKFPVVGGIYATFL